MNSATTNQFLKKNPQLVSLLKNKWVLFDSDAIIRILSFDQKEIFDALDEIGVKNCSIHPVKVELNRTNSLVERALRNSIFDQYRFTFMPLTTKELDNAFIIQSWLAGRTCFPSPIDLYQAGVMFSYSKNTIFLLTGNVKDFPSPLFEKKEHIILANENSVQVLTFLSINKDLIESEALP